ncbi:acyltransferase family protein [Flavisphingomonas formosensis]|uniref:acyltransferase family protein n=1 Tax=Flavisphingomonas formosensis TaxID=861534 RepID=UPI0012FA3B01|nr:acyltransferase [Sphingomonas formosensis]
MTERHDNNFTFLRFVAASMVIVAHAYDLLNQPAIKDPLFQLIGRTMGWTGVSIFFTMSGFLIMNSLNRSANLVKFARARALRIFPGLSACILLSIVFLGIFATSRPLVDYFTDVQTLRFAVGNISLLSIQYILPGVFQHNPMPAVNGSLWTLPYEVICYILAAFASGLGLLRSDSRRAATFAVSLFMILAFVAFQAHRPSGGISTRLLLMSRLDACFIFGMAYATFGNRFKLRIWHAAALGLISWLTAATPFYDLTLSAALAAFVLWLAFVPSQILRRISRWPDYSYGIYIYAFPIQQFLIMKTPGLTPALHALTAFPLVLIPASLSWHFIEKPALKLKNLGTKRDLFKSTADVPAE